MKTLYDKETGEIKGWYHSSKGDDRMSVGDGTYGEIDGKYDRKKYFIKDGKPVERVKLNTASVRKVGDEIVISGLPENSSVITEVDHFKRGRGNGTASRAIANGRKDRRDANGEVRFTIPPHMRNQKLKFTINGVDIELSELDIDTETK